MKGFSKRNESNFNGSKAGIPMILFKKEEARWWQMEYIAYLAPVAFVFALSALAQVATLKKELDRLKGEIESLKRSI